MTPPFDFPAAGSLAAGDANTEEGQMPELKRYNVKVGKYDTVVQLNAEDAKAQGLSDSDLADAPAKKSEAKKAAGPVGAKKAPAPANKARKAPNKDA